MKRRDYGAVIEFIREDVLGEGAFPEIVHWKDNLSGGLHDPLMWIACDNEDMTMLKLLLSCPALDVNYANWSGSIVTHMAYYCRDEELKVLLRHPLARTDIPASDDETPLH